MWDILDFPSRAFSLLVRPFWNLSHSASSSMALACYRMMKEVVSKAVEFSIIFYYLMNNNAKIILILICIYLSNLLFNQVRMKVYSIKSPDETFSQASFTLRESFMAHLPSHPCGTLCQLPPPATHPNVRQTHHHPSPAPPSHPPQPLLAPLADLHLLQHHPKVISGHHLGDWAFCFPHYLLLYPF